ncbi:MAG: peptidylprolyl isomerase [Chloroflexi bacterium]|nr:MAG: peptidylprolyl isomerase [Chloroflexota bacterium]
MALPTKNGELVNDIKDPTVVADDVVVTMEYTLTVNGEVIDSSEGTDPLEFLQGYQNIVPGLERELYGMKVGQSKKVTVSPADGYGEVDTDAFLEISRSEFPDDIPLELGVELDLRDEDGEIMSATISKVEGDMVQLDLNHPLAGETLDFEVKVVGLRLPTEEELEHGHVHGHDHDDYDEDFDEEFIDAVDAEDEE